MSLPIINQSRAERCAFVVLGDRGRLLEQVAFRLETSGFKVDFLRPPLIQPAEPYRLLVLRAKTLDVTSWAKVQQQRGTVVVPDPRSIELIKDRWTCSQILTAAGLRLPEALMGNPVELHVAGVKHLLPVVLKQRRVHRGAVRLLLNCDELADELNRFPDSEELVAEHFIEGVHFTACFIGAQIFCFLKPPLRPGIAESTPLSDPPPQILRSVELYRQASGLLFGKIDVVMTSSSEVFVVDSSVSPNLWPVLEADRLLHNCLVSLLNRDQDPARLEDTINAGTISAMAKELEKLSSITKDG